MAEATVHIDGAARGNPGPAAYAFVLRRNGHPDLEQAEPIGKATNNVAEYTALVKALEKAVELGIQSLAVFSDSELLVKQMNGEYKVKHPDMRALFDEANAIKKQLKEVTLTHVRRAENADADRLGNEALDAEKKRNGPEPTVKKPVFSEVRTPSVVEEEAVALLNAARAAWIAGREEPSPIELWDKLWALSQSAQGTRTA